MSAGCAPVALMRRAALTGCPRLKLLPRGGMCSLFGFELSGEPLVVCAHALCLFLCLLEHLLLPLYQAVSADA